MVHLRGAILTVEGAERLAVHVGKRERGQTVADAALNQLAGSDWRIDRL
jgi:hypothetical protein